MSAGSIGASATGARIVIEETPVRDDNYLRHLTVTLGDLHFGSTFEVDQAPDLVGQLRRVADSIETWDGGRSARP